MHHARLGVILAGLAALGLAALVEGCLFAPDDCGDLLKCSGAGGAGGAAGPASTASSSAATTGSGGCSSNGGCPLCVNDAECGPPMHDGCTVSTCVASVCTPKDTTGILAATQTPNDCKKNVCGANGKPAPADDPLDLPADEGNACTDQTCVGGTPTFVPVALGTACASGKCDANGICVNCAKDLDCTMGTTPTCDLTLNTCISCSDGIKNGTETTPDCGGICKSCNGDPCTKDGDCGSGQCADGVCCDTDCNGPCQACNLLNSVGACTSLPIGQPDPVSCPAGAPVCNAAGMCKKAAGVACGNDDECGSGACLAGLCRTEIGGACVSNLTCASGRCLATKCAACVVAGDCTSMMCNAGVCKVPLGSACDIDTDCAAGTCKLKLCLVDNPGACSVAADCVSGVCTANKCAPCANGNDCGANVGCGGVFGVSACSRPKGAYCANNTQCYGLAPCTGFPPTCQ